MFNTKKETMVKIAIATCFTLLLDVRFGFLPKAWLLAILFLAMGCDTLSAVIRLKLMGYKVSNSKLKSGLLKKIFQYGGAVVINMLISLLSIVLKEYNGTWDQAPQIMAWVNNALFIFLIYLELRSIVKNLILVDRHSPVATTLFKPTYKMLTLKIKNNAVAKFFIEAPDGDAELEQEEMSEEKKEQLKSKKD